jgi:hypothetical protein
MQSQAVGTFLRIAENTKGFDSDTLNRARRSVRAYQATHRKIGRWLKRTWRWCLATTGAVALFLVAALLAASR